MLARRALPGAGIAAAILAFSGGQGGAQPDPLPSWNDGVVKKSIADFVARVTLSIGADFVPVAERIAVFDNDGTLWAEQPVYFQFPGVEFMRPWVEKVYGIPPEQVVGSSGEVKFETGSDAKPVLRKLAKVEFIDDGPGKPVGINRFIGRRPIFAFGNSDGDQQMLRWTAARAGARFVGIVHHTDAEREWTYDRKSHVGKLDKALDEGTAKSWIIVDMKRDWKKVFAFQP